MSSARWAARLGMAAALSVAGGCIAVLAANAVGDRKLLAAHPGQPAPDFVLPTAAGEPTPGPFRLSERRGAIVVAYFCAAGCPASNDYAARVVDLFRRYEQDCRVEFVAVHTGSAAATGSEVAVRATAAGLRFTHLSDPEGSVARRYAVRHTPTFLVVDPAGRVAYRGAFDNHRNPAQATVPHVENALRDLLTGRPVARPFTEAAGCPVR